MLPVFLSFLLTSLCRPSSQAPDPPKGPWLLLQSRLISCLQQTLSGDCEKTWFDWVISLEIWFLFYWVNFPSTNSHINSGSNFRCVSNQAVPFFLFLQTAELCKSYFCPGKVFIHCCVSDERTSCKRLICLVLKPHVSVYYHLGIRWCVSRERLVQFG